MKLNIDEINIYDAAKIVVEVFEAQEKSSIEYSDVDDMFRKKDELGLYLIAKELSQWSNEEIEGD